MSLYACVEVRGQFMVVGALCLYPLSHFCQPIYYFKSSF